MSRNHTWHFDVLPFRPPPFQGECLSGYMLRLADANGFGRLWPFVQRIYPDWTAKTSHMIVLRWEFPVNDYGLLPQLTASSLHTLKALTVAPLVEKFLGTGLIATRSIVPGRLLRGVVNPNLKVCPLCLSSEPYVRLIWRFADVAVCVRHQCRLVGHCQRCGYLLTSADSQQRHLHCASCDADLRLFKSEPVSARECAVQSSRIANLQSTLETGTPPVEDAVCVIGHKFKYLRHLRKISAKRLARDADIGASHVLDVELGRSASIATRLMYLDWLEATWSDFAQLVVPAKFIDSLKTPRHMVLRCCPELGCVNATASAAARHVYGVFMLRDVPQKALARFQCHACGRRFTRQYSGELSGQRDGIEHTRRLRPDFATQLPRLKRLALSGLTQVDIAKRMDWYSSTVRTGLMTLGILKEAKQAQRRRRKTTALCNQKTQTAAWLVKVTAALKRLSRRPVKFHLIDVVREAGLSIYQIHKWPLVNAHVASIMRNHNALLTEQHQVNARRKILHQIQSLSKSQKVTTLTNVASECGVSMLRLRKRHPDLLYELRLVLRKNRQHARQLHRQTVTRQIEVAARTLTKSGVRLSGPSILREAGLNQYIRSSPYVHDALRHWIGSFAPRD